jgi:SAM-dependent methyltransferase
VADNSFDSIVCTETLTNVFDLPKPFSEFRRVLKPGGAALISAGCLVRLNIDVGEYWRFTPSISPSRKGVIHWFGVAANYNIVSGSLPPPCNAGLDQDDAGHIRDVESHIWSSM